MDFYFTYTFFGSGDWASIHTPETEKISIFSYGIIFYIEFFALIQKFCYSAYIRNNDPRFVKISDILKSHPAYCTPRALDISDF